MDEGTCHQKKIHKELERYIVHNAKIEPPFELVVERLCKRYGWKPEDVMGMDMYWVNVFLDIIDLDARREWKESKRQQLRKEEKKNNG